MKLTVIIRMIFVLVVAAAENVCLDVVMPLGMNIFFF